MSPSHLIATLSSCFAFLGLACAGQAQTPITLSPESLIAPKPEQAIKTLDEARQVSPRTKTVTVGFLKDRSKAAEILKALAGKPSLSAIKLRSGAINPEAIAELRNLKSLRSLTLDRRHPRLGSAELHKAVSDLSQLNSLHIRWIDLAGP